MPWSPGHQVKGGLLLPPWRTLIAMQVAQGGAMQSVRQWLEQLGLADYAESFQRNAVDFDLLRELTDHDLEKIGVLLGHRKKLLKAIETLRNSGAIAPRRSPDSYTPKHLAEKILTSKSALEGERKQVTVLFA